MSYIKDNFLLSTKTAEKLYNDYAKKMPIYDYHCHLSEKAILENKPFKDIYEIWLAGDHYKWRLMRNYGINEEYITGNKSNKDKFITYCKVLGTAFGNPLYHWSQLELKEFFGCEIEINEANAEEIWRVCNEYISKINVTPQSLIEQSNVSHVFTTNEVTDELSVFAEIAKKNYKFKVLPSFRADKVMNIEADGFYDIINTLGARSLDDLEKALEERLKAFIKAGALASDISLQYVCPVPEKECAERVFEARLNKKEITLQEASVFRGYITYSLMKLYAKYGICTELHIGALRRNNAVMTAKLGADTGYDSIAEDNSTANLSKLFDKLNSQNALPKTIIFNLNPKLNTEFVTLMNCFQSDEAKGKLQYGPAWWFLDHKNGIEQHLKDLSANGHLGAFVGMLTDSRSFLSYPRHHYFRRILCNYLGNMIENGEMTSDIELVGKVVKDICYNNASNYFGGNK